MILSPEVYTSGHHHNWLLREISTIDELIVISKTPFESEQSSISHFDNGSLQVGLRLTGSIWHSVRERTAAGRLTVRIRWREGRSRFSFVIFGTAARHQQNGASREASFHWSGRIRKALIEESIKERQTIEKIKSLDFG